METLRHHTERLQREIEVKTAWLVLKDHFDPTRPRRFISGVAVSSGRKNQNGYTLKAGGMTATLPVPLLLDHCWLRPIGKIFAIGAWGPQVTFQGEIVNTDRLHWAAETWEALVSRRLTAVSVQGRCLQSSIIDKTYSYWAVEEISVAECGADPHAGVRRVWQKEACAYIDRPSYVLHWEIP